MAYGITTVPSGCKHQTTGLGEFRSLAELPAEDLVAYFRMHADAANRVLGQSYDKRCSPSTFVEEVEGGFRVGWFDGKRQHLRQFANFSEAIADYILFSFGKGRLEC